MSDLQSLPNWADVKLRQRHWFVILTGLLFVPLGLILLWFQTTYRRDRQGAAAKMPIWEKAVISLGFVAFAYMMTGPVQSWLTKGERSAGLPTCSAKAARETLIEAFDKSQFARQLSLSVVDLGQIKDGEMTGQIRKCTAIAMLNNTERVHINFTMENRSNGNFLLTFQVVDEPQKPAPARVQAQNKAQAVPSASTTAPAKPPGDLWQDLIGRHPYDVMTDRAVREAYSGHFGEEFKSFLAGLEVAGPTELVEGRYLVGAGCVPHQCGDAESFFVADIRTGAFEAFVFYNGDVEKVAVVGDLIATAALTAKFETWLQH